MFSALKKINLAMAALAVFALISIPLMAKDGAVVGKVNSVNKNTKEIIVNTESGKSLKLGDKLYVRVDGKPVLMTVTFPMMTTSKCKPDKNAKNIGSISKGLTVYLYEKGIEEAVIEAVDEKLYEGNPIVGTWDFTIRIYETGDSASGKLTFNTNGTFVNDRLRDSVRGKAWKDTGKFRFDIEKGILEFPGKEGTDMFYAGPLRLVSKENNSLLFVFRHKQGYSIQYTINHSNTAPFNLAKEEVVE